MKKAIHTVLWSAPDLLDSQAISLPQATFELKTGAVVDITFPPANNVGRLTVIGEPKADKGRGLFTCHGSKYDGRKFDLAWGNRSDISADGVPIFLHLDMHVRP